MKPSRSFPDTTRMSPPPPEPSATDASSTDPSSTDPSLGADSSHLQDGDTSSRSSGDASPAGGADATDPVLESEPVAGKDHATAAGEESVAPPGVPPRSVMTVFKELAKCPDLNALTAHVQANPEILDFLQSRRGMLPVFSDKPPPTFPAPGQLRSYDDYVDVLFTKQADGSWRIVNYSR